MLSPCTLSPRCVHAQVENDETAELQKEIGILKECHSPYIVAYKGSFEKDGNMWVRAMYMLVCTRVYMCTHIKYMQLARKDVSV